MGRMVSRSLRLACARGRITSLCRLRRSYPSYINVPGLLIDIVSVMGEYLQCAAPSSILTNIYASRIYPGRAVSTRVQCQIPLLTISTKACRSYSIARESCAYAQQAQGSLQVRAHGTLSSAAPSQPRRSLSIVETLGSVNVLCSVGFPCGSACSVLITYILSRTRLGPSPRTRCMSSTSPLTIRSSSPQHSTQCSRMPRRRLPRILSNWLPSEGFAMPQSSEQNRKTDRNGQLRETRQVCRHLHRAFPTRSEWS